MSDWDYPFSKEEVAAWKHTHGDSNVHLVLVEDEPYVVRGLGRAEFQELSEIEFRSDEHMEDEFSRASLLYPQLGEVELRNLPGGVTNNLFETVMEKSNIEAWRDKEISKFTTKWREDLSEGEVELIETKLSSGDITDDDIKGIIVNPKNRGLVHVTEFEGELIFYKGLNRADFEKLRSEQRDGKYQGPASEEELCNRCIIFPFKFTAASDQWLHGTISSLSLMIMRVSGFGATKEVVTL